MEAWWNSLDTALQVYYGVAIVTSAVLAAQLLLLLVGLDGDVDDLDLDADHPSGMGILSVRTVTAFFTGFGWGGVLALEAGWPLAAATFASLVAGAALMASVFFLMRGLASMRYSGTLDYRNAIGVSGNVYLPIPPKMSAPGQVEVRVQGRLRTVRAFTRAAERIPNRARVRVVDVVDPHTLLVEPLDPPAETPGPGPGKEQP